MHQTTHIGRATINDHLYSAELCKQLYNFPSKNTMILHKEREKKLYVVLQGTNSICHWLHNISILPTKDEGVHTGFKQYANLCKNELVDTIMTSKHRLELDNVEKIYLTAHSLGASAIIILVYQMLKDGIFSDHIRDLNIDIVLFGAPKSGDTRFLRNFDAILNRYPKISLYRYNVDNDLIKHYPPIFTYAHICNEITLHHTVVENKFDVSSLLYNHSINCYIECMLSKYRY